MKKYALFPFAFFLAFNLVRCQNSYQPDARPHYHVSVYFGSLGDQKNVLLDSAERVWRRRIEGALIYTRLERDVNQPEITIDLADEMSPPAGSPDWKTLDRICPLLSTEGRLGIYGTYGPRDKAVAAAMPRLLKAKPALSQKIRLNNNAGATEIGSVNFYDAIEVERLLKEAREEGLLPAGCRPVLSYIFNEHPKLYFLKDSSIISTHNIVDAQAAFPEQKDEDEPASWPKNVPVRLRFDAEGTEALRALSATCARDGRALVVLYEDHLLYYPQPAQPVTDGLYEFAGNFNAPRAVEVANILRGGQLPGLPQVTSCRTLK